MWSSKSVKIIVLCSSGLSLKEATASGACRPHPWLPTRGWHIQVESSDKP